MLVGAFACAHTPQLLARPGTEDRDLVLRVHAAFGRVKGRLEALRADAIAIVAGDHVEAFFLDSVPALAVYVGAECAPERSDTIATASRSTSPWRERSWSRGSSGASISATRNRRRSTTPSTFRSTSRCRSPRSRSLRCT